MAAKSDPVPSPGRRGLLKLALGAGAFSGGVSAGASVPAAAAAPGDVSPMRGRALAIGGDAEGLTTPSLAGIVLNRAGFGPWPGDLAAFEALGATDDQRLQAWVDMQLDPASIPDVDCDWRLANSGYTTLGKPLGQLWADHVVPSPPWDVRLRPFWETQRATFTRAVYSRRQLNEVLADFWHNHFNVFGEDFNHGPVFVHHDRDVIRPHMLGNFRVMLEAVAKSTAMLYMLDNYTSSVAGPNENFARELFELHTLGAENYLGVMRQDEVPVDAQGRPVGYVDADVFEATRCFTGWSVANGSSGAPNTGAFHYRPTWHDRFQKSVLRVFIPPDQADMMDGAVVLDTLAAHPGTARFVSRKLCRRFIGDSPSQTTVDAIAALFHAQRNAPDQLRQVVRAILLSAEFRATWGAKVKRPFEVMVSAMRAAAAQFPFVLGHPDSDGFAWFFGHAGQQLFNRRSPDGYPDNRDAWLAPNPRVGCWRLCTWLMNEPGAGTYYLDVVAQTPLAARSANQITDFWIDRVFGRVLSAAERTAAVTFMAQGADPAAALPWNDAVKHRVRALVGLLFWSPEFLYR